MTEVTVPAGRARAVVGGRRAPVVGLAALALLVNLAFAAALLVGGGTAVLGERAEQSPRVTLAAPLDERRVLVATLGNEVIRLEGGRPAASVAFPNVVGGLAASAGRDEVYVGTSNG